MTERDIFSGRPRASPTRPPGPPTWTRPAAATPPCGRGSRRCSAPHDRPDSFLDAPAVAARPGRGPDASVPPDAGPGDGPTRTHGGRGRRRRRRARLPRPARPARLARPARALRGAGGARPGRLRHRLPGVRRRAAARGRGQGAGPAAGRHLAGPQAVPARGPVVGRRSGTRTSCRSTPSRSSRCRTW